MRNATLEAQNLSVSVKQRLLFYIPALSVSPGQAIHLTGQNGAGKTTLLKVLAGITQPSGGSLNLNQPSVLRRLAGFASGRSSVIYMHQSPYLFDASVSVNIEYGLKNQCISHRTRRKIALEALKLADLRALADEHISVLSGGEKQKVAIARAWAMRPAFLLMDESCANLDAEAIQDQKRMADDLLQSGTGLVITSHQTNALTASCHIQWTLENQRLRQTPLLNTLDKDNHAVAS